MQCSSLEHSIANTKRITGIFLELGVHMMCRESVSQIELTGPPEPAGLGREVKA